MSTLSYFLHSGRVSQLLVCCLSIMWISFVDGLLVSCMQDIVRYLRLAPLTGRCEEVCIYVWKTNQNFNSTDECPACNWFGSRAISLEFDSLFGMQNLKKHASLGLSIPNV